MKWNWDFLRNRKTEIHPILGFRQDPPPADLKMIMVNGHARRIDGSDLSDMEVAGRVRMLMRGQLDHESVCTLARDRIVYMADRLGEIESITAEDAGRAIYAKQCSLTRLHLRAIGIAELTWDEIPEETRRLYVDLGKSVLVLITGAPAPALEKAPSC